MAGSLVIVYIIDAQSYTEDPPIPCNQPRYLALFSFAISMSAFFLFNYLDLLFGNSVGDVIVDDCMVA